MEKTNRIATSATIDFRIIKPRYRETNRLLLLLFNGKEMNNNNNNNNEFSKSKTILRSKRNLKNHFYRNRFTKREREQDILINNISTSTKTTINCAKFLIFLTISLIIAFNAIVVFSETVEFSRKSLVNNHQHYHQRKQPHHINANSRHRRDKTTYELSSTNYLQRKNAFNEQNVPSVTTTTTTNNRNRKLKIDSKLLENQFKLLNDDHQSHNNDLTSNSPHRRNRRRSTVERLNPKHSRDNNYYYSTAKTKKSSNQNDNSNEIVQNLDEPEVFKSKSLWTIVSSSEPAEVAEKWNIENDDDDEDLLIGEEEEQDEDDDDLLLDNNEDFNDDDDEEEGEGDKDDDDDEEEGEGDKDDDEDEFDNEINQRTQFKPHYRKLFWSHNNNNNNKLHSGPNKMKFNERDNNNNHHNDIIPTPSETATTTTTSNELYNSANYANDLINPYYHHHHHHRDYFKRKVPELKNVVDDERVINRFSAHHHHHFKHENDEKQKQKQQRQRRQKLKQLPPIVVSISDNSFVSASPIKSAYYSAASKNNDGFEEQVDSSNVNVDDEKEREDEFQEEGIARGANENRGRLEMIYNNQNSSFSGNNNRSRDNYIFNNQSTATTISSSIDSHNYYSNDLNELELKQRIEDRKVLDEKQRRGSISYDSVNSKDLLINHLEATTTTTETTIGATVAAAATNSFNNEPTLLPSSQHTQLEKIITNQFEQPNFNSNNVPTIILSSSDDNNVASNQQQQVFTFNDLNDDSNNANNDNFNEIHQQQQQTNPHYSNIVRSPNNELAFHFGRGQDNNNNNNNVDGTNMKQNYWQSSSSRVANYPSHKASIDISQEQEPDEFHKGGLNSALIAILFGIGATGMLIMIVGHKMRSMSERVAYRGRRRSLVPDTDFLINTIPI